MELVAWMQLQANLTFKIVLRLRERESLKGVIWKNRAVDGNLVG